MESSSGKRAFSSFPDGSEVTGENVGKYPVYRQYHFFPEKQKMPYPVQILYVRRELDVKGVWRDWKKINFLSMEYILKGSFLFRQNNQENFCKKGDLIMMHLRGKNSLRCLEDGSEKLIVALCGNSCQALLETLNLSGYNVIRNVSENFITLFENAERLLKTRLPDYDQELAAAAYRFLLFAAKNRMVEDVPQRLRDILGYISQSSAGPVSLRELCRRFHISAPTLFRDFKQYLNKTPVEYITEHRLGQAEMLLQQPELSIKKIADMTGFSSPYYFSSVFRKYNGQSPSEYRANLSKKR